MAIPPLILPAPSTRAQQPSEGRAPPPPIEVNIPTVRVDFPKPPETIGLQVLSANANQLPAGQQIQGLSFPWQRGGPIMIRAINTTDVIIRVRAYAGIDASTSLLNDLPLAEIDVGPGAKPNVKRLDPATDTWGPYCWITVEAVSVPSLGNVIVQMSRLGDL